MEINTNLSKEQKQSGSDFIAYMATMIEAEKAQQVEESKNNQADLISQLKNLSASEKEELRGIVFGEKQSSNDLNTPSISSNEDLKSEESIELDDSGVMEIKQ